MKPNLTVAIAGGGLAGLAAACALADSGFRVTLFERRPTSAAAPLPTNIPAPEKSSTTASTSSSASAPTSSSSTAALASTTKSAVRRNDFRRARGTLHRYARLSAAAPLHTAHHPKIPFLTPKDKHAISRAIAALVSKLSPTPAARFSIGAIATDKLPTPSSASGSPSSSVPQRRPRPHLHPLRRASRP